MDPATERRDAWQPTPAHLSHLPQRDPMRTPAPSRSTTELTQPDAVANSLRRPAVASRSYVLAFGCGRSTLTPPPSPTRPATKPAQLRAAPPAPKNHHLDTQAG